MGPWGRTDGIKWWGRAAAFGCLTGGKIVFVMAERCSVLGKIYFQRDLYLGDLYFETQGYCRVFPDSQYKHTPDQTSLKADITSDLVVSDGP